MNNPLTYFYDIESLDNAFTLCNYKAQDNIIDVFCLVDDNNLLNLFTFEHELRKRILEKNKNFNGTIKFYNLQDESANRYLAETFGLSDAYLVNNPNDISSYPSEFRPVCDTDPYYDNTKHPYLMGYNSYNYDTTMLALYLYEVFQIKETKDNKSKSTYTTNFEPITAHAMREYNNQLFQPKFKDSMPSRLAFTYDYSSNNWVGPNYSDRKYKIRKSMLMSGRHLDVARLNEKQQKVGLKRLLGMLGYQILESDKLTQGADHIDNIDQLLDLIAYNVSDVVNLELLFKHRAYFSQFSLKKGLLERYPELIYDRIQGEYKPDIRPEKVRRDRLMIDSSSAQLATKSLCPYDHLTDIPAVSFMYPSEIKAKELGIERKNILDESKKFFYENFNQPELRAKFDTIYNFYKSIEGKNFNESNNYNEDYFGTPEYQEPNDLSKLPKQDMCMFYYKQDGSPSTCFVTFSTGGIHGAEYNNDLYRHHMKLFEKELSYFEFVKKEYPDPVALRAAKKVTIPDGTEFSYTHFLKTGASLKHAEYKDIESKRPQLFVTGKNGIVKLNNKYTYTSADPANHEDFTSYYPNMLRMLSAFYNEGLGYDRYAEIFDDKQKYGKLMKDKSLSEEDRAYYNVLREGTKLILNSASGAGDATFESNIRMNNMIISMRIIGQLFSWRIGQAQTLKGAKITSTNTDGLYSVLESTVNDIILAQESADIGVEIEPEPMYLISKDSNNRIEATDDLSKILGASGGTLACRKGPVPTKSLAHPAIIDWALTEYLVAVSSGVKNLSLSSPFDDDLGREILDKAQKEFEPVKYLNMFQNVIASSNGSMTYIFGTNDIDPDIPVIMQHYNRVFIMKDDTPPANNILHLHAAVAKKLTPATIKKRATNHERAQQHDNLALQVLSANGVHIKDIPDDKEATIKKLTGIDESWYMYIENRNLEELSDKEIDFIISNIDYEKYLQLLHESFEKNWRNIIPDDLYDMLTNGCTVNLDINNETKTVTITDEAIIRQIYESI